MRTRALLRLLIILSVAFVLVPGPAHAVETEAGLITKIDPPGGRYYVIHRGSSGDAKIDRAIVLREGDEIYLVDLDTRLTLNLIGEENEIIISRHNELPYRVRLKAQSDSPWLMWLLQELAPREEETRLTPANIRGRGGEFSVHLLDRPQQIAAGNRSLTIAWNIADGESTAIAIRPLHGPTLAATTTKQHSWTTPAINLKPGFYSFEFRLEQPNHEEKRQFEIVEPERVPLTRIDLNTKSPDLQRIVEAGALAARSKGVFSLEAFQIISPFETRSPAAKLLYDALLDGAWTEKLP